MKTKFSTRILALVLMLAMIVPMLVFTVSAEDKTIVFELGDDGAATHYDPNSTKATYSETVDGYTLNITGGTNMYPGARDAKGNGCIKFGTGSKAGSCTIAVPDDVTSVVLYVAAYKAKTATVDVNGTKTTLSTKSDNGAYDAITVDTTTTKTISFQVSSGYRAMLNTIKFIVAGNADDSATAIFEALNTLEPMMSLAYKYDTAIETVSKPSTATDTLDREFTGVTSGNAYVNWSDKTGASGAVYAGNSYPGNKEAIQLKSADSTSGIVTTTSGGKIKSITITWNAKTTGGRKLDIYGKNTAYTAASDLYDTAKDGDKVTSLTYASGTETQTYVFEDDYAYIGIRSNSGALYIDSIEIEWDTGAGADGTVEQEVYSNSQFAFRFGVNEALSAIEGIDAGAYGLVVSAGGKDVYFSTNATSWKQEGGFYHITLSLGDIINDTVKLSTEFTVKAYVEVDGEKYISTNVKTYSVAEMVAVYHNDPDVDVAHFYNYLVGKGLI